VVSVSIDFSDVFRFFIFADSNKRERRENLQKVSIQIISVVALILSCLKFCSVRLFAAPECIVQCYAIQLLEYLLPGLTTYIKRFGSRLQFFFNTTKD